MAPTSAASVFSSALFSSSSLSLSRPITREGAPDSHNNNAAAANANPSSSSLNAASKERKISPFTRKPSLPSRRRGTLATVANSNDVVTDANAPPALPDYALAAAAKVVIHDKEKKKNKDKEKEKERDRERDKDKEKSGREALEEPWSPSSPREMMGYPLTRTATSQTMSAQMVVPSTPGGTNGNGGGYLQYGETALIHHQITELAQKRLSTLHYLRRAHEGRIYWFNTYLIDRPDLNRMPSFDSRKLARKATSYFLLGLSIPTINDLYSSTPVEFLRCLNSLFSEFDSFQQLHGDHSPSAASLTRARLPSMFRRQGAKSRRQGSTSASSDAIVDDSSTLSSTSAWPSTAVMAAAAGTAGPAPAVMNFAASETDLLPGEEYTYLLTPSLPFDPDFFETFATLCDVLIDCYTRFLALVPTPREVTASIAELFTKADSKMRKIIVQGVVKDFEEHSRTHIKSEVVGIGRIVLGGLM